MRHCPLQLSTGAPQVFQSRSARYFFCSTILGHLGTSLRVIIQSKRPICLLIPHIRGSWRAMLSFVPAQIWFSGSSLNLRFNICAPKSFLPRGIKEFCQRLEAELGGSTKALLIKQRSAEIAGEARRQQTSDDLTQPIHKEH